MADEREIQQALQVLSQERRNKGKPHSRHHHDTDDDNFNRWRALKGICADCTNLIIAFHNDQGRKVVSLRCRANCSPLLLYNSTNLGETAECDKFNSKEQPELSPSC